MVEQEIEQTIPGFKYLDDRLFNEEKEDLTEIKSLARNLCPSLGVCGEFFYFCETMLPKKTGENFTEKQVYKGHVTRGILKSKCMKDYDNCSFYASRTRRD